MNLKQKKCKFFFFFLFLLNNFSNLMSKEEIKPTETNTVSNEREDSVYMAKLAEQAERYEGKTKK
jgi:hypothetical protein